MEINVETLEYLPHEVLKHIEEIKGKTHDEILQHKQKLIQI